MPQYVKDWSRDTSVGIQTGLTTEEMGVRFPTGSGEFSLLHSILIDCGAHPASHSLSMKRPDHKADHSFRLVMTIRMGGTSTPPPQVLAYCLIKHRNNLTFYFHLHNIFNMAFGMYCHLLLLKLLPLLMLLLLLLIILLLVFLLLKVHAPSRFRRIFEVQTKCVSHSL